ncbi:MAG TPA: hypothetical protein VHX86_09890 [Tepidisphaeraceae bacterium]|jgi:hypothetical protein|nr:hypothetical protein [Tepidisphaeraceae bacterium]
MAKFVKIEDLVIDLEKITCFEKTADDLIIWILSRENPVVFRSDQGSAVYSMLLKVLAPESWKVPAREGTGAFNEP